MSGALSTAEDVARAFYAAYNDRDAEAIRRLLADEYQHATSGGRLVEGADAYLDDLKREWANRPDARIDVIRATPTAEGVVVEGAWNVTSLNPIELPDGTTLKPTGQSGVLPFASIFVVDGDRLVRDTSYYETMALWRSLGHSIRIE